MIQAVCKFPPTASCSHLLLGFLLRVFDAAADALDFFLVRLDFFFLGRYPGNITMVWTSFDLTRFPHPSHQSHYPSHSQPLELFLLLQFFFMGLLVLGYLCLHVLCTRVSAVSWHLQQLLKRRDGFGLPSACAFCFSRPAKQHTNACDSCPHIISSRGNKLTSFSLLPSMTSSFCFFISSAVWELCSLDSCLASAIFSLSSWWAFASATSLYTTITRRHANPALSSASACPCSTTHAPMHGAHKCTRHPTTRVAHTHSFSLALAFSHTFFRFSLRSCARARATMS